ncbi:cysteine proteinase inhibitor 3-like isoform X1 [Arachis stenosperma]|uniref:cysteine proteinase inhibitor 3-like isoform X1 n=1 Tax=Arachis stenosperma TaxID=217475 RepID=UPI0025ACA6DC|nr:cysteine proteinase inhibitor 3-like isoform X1 [Arachis stenosperma]
MYINLSPLINMPDVRLFSKIDARCALYSHHKPLTLFSAVTLTSLASSPWILPRSLQTRDLNSSLELVRVISAKEQVVAGSIYEITMVAKDGDEKKQVYEAKVLVKPWLNFKELQEFKLVTDDDNENDNAASVSRALI